MAMQRPRVAVERVQCRMRIPLVDLKGQYGQIRTDVVKALWDVLDEMDLRLGPNVRGFESEFAAHCGARHAVGVGSGSDALYLALRACGVCAGDEVITVANGHLSTTEAILRLGAVPVYVDVESRTYTLDPGALAPAIGERTRAVVPVHLYGQVADMDAIREVAQHYGLSVVEDASQAHGAEYRGRRAGSLGDAAAFSLSVTKNLGAYGDAGVVTTGSRAVADEVRRLRNHGVAPAVDQHAAIIDVARDGFGINSRLDELHAAVLRVKLRHLDAWNAQRRRHAAAYDQLLAGTPIVTPRERDDASHVYHYYVVQVPDRERARRALRDRGIETAVHYPVPLYRRGGSSEIGRVVGDLGVTEELARRVLSLPMYPELEPSQLAYVADCLRLTDGEGSSALAVSVG
jgi:dTDP-4-amino-4,6-dideoxygalactose transaminase